MSRIMVLGWLFAVANVALCTTAQAILYELNTTRMCILGYDYLFNLDRRVVSIEWVILECLDQGFPVHHPQGVFETSTQCGPFNRAVDIYLNNGSDKIFSYDPNHLPADPIRGPIPIWELISFRTEHELYQSEGSVDTYTFRAFVFVIDPVTNLSVDIARFTIADSADGLTVARLSTREDTTIGIGSRALEVEFRRSKPSGSTITMCMLAMSWALTLVSAYITLVAMTKGRIDSTTITIHASTVLGILGIWIVYADGQPFRADLGMMGFFSQVITEAFCSTVLMCIAAKPHSLAQVSPWNPENA